jgi:selenocysteine lyase/cysteine desulfurase
MCRCCPAHPWVALAFVSDVLSAARALFDPQPETIYLDAATYGLPPRPTVEAMHRAVDDWQSGSADWVRNWDQAGERCRADFATLIGSTPQQIALIPTVSVGVGTIAASLTDADEVLTADDEFTSVLYPLLARAVKVRTAPLEQLAERITKSTSVVAFSLIQSQSGKAAPLEDILSKAKQVNAKTLVDATHAVPFVPLPSVMQDVDFLVCAAYKHLLCPRGVSFLHVQERHWQGVKPILANWRSTPDPYGQYYGGGLDLAPDAARFDVSLAWFSWAGGAESLRLLTRWQQQGLFEEVVQLARRLAKALDLPEPRGSVVSVPVKDAEAVRVELAREGIKGAVRAGSVRLSPHVWNTEQHVDAAANAIAPYVLAPTRA